MKAPARGTGAFVCPWARTGILRRTSSLPGQTRVWYRIPESRRASGGVRLSTVGTVGSDQIRWIPASLRVRMRVHASQPCTPSTRKRHMRQDRYGLQSGLPRFASLRPEIIVGCVVHEPSLRGHAVTDVKGLRTSVLDRRPVALRVDDDEGDRVLIGCRNIVKLLPICAP